VVWRFLAAGLLAVSTAGCSNTTCVDVEEIFIDAGDTYAGVDPRDALTALPAQAIPSWWLSHESMTLTITAVPSGDPSRVVADCAGAPAGFSIPTTFRLQSDDGRLDGSFTAELPADLAATLTLPAVVRGQMPLTALNGMGIVPDTYLDLAANMLAVYLDVTHSGAGAAYTNGYLYLAGHDSVLIAIVDVQPP